VWSRVYGALGTGINLSFVKEVQIKTGGFEPQYGHVSGGINPVGHQVRRHQVLRNRRRIHQQPLDAGHLSERGRPQVRGDQTSSEAASRTRTMKVTSSWADTFRSMA